MAKGPSTGGPEDRRSTAGTSQQPVATGPLRTAPTPDGLRTGAEALLSEDLQERMLGEFRMLRRLGRGGMAEVYLAEQTSLKRNVAVKLLHKDRVADASYVARFKTEAMAAGSLSHPNIVQVLVIGEQDGIQYIAQEYVPGLNLRELLARKGPPELALALRIIRQAANALQAAHNAGIVHRDIKPENIMITRKGDVKVADFGLAQLTQEGERLNLTQDGVTMGTPLYMSPEQVNGSKVDHRTDIYSLGVTCYHLLSGAPPFRGETAVSIALQHLKDEPESLEQLRSDLPPLLCRIIHKMMAKDPDQRYQSAQAILKDLKRVTADGDAKDDAPADHDVSEPRLSDKPAGNAVVRILRAVWHSPDWPVSRQVWTVLLLGLLIGGASAGVGWVTRTADPFEARLPPASGVTKKESAAGQYFYAVQQKDNLEAWQAVVDYFPASADALFRNYAEQQMATLYLTKRRYDEAQAIFDRFAEYNEPQFRAFGLAGQAVLWNLRGDCQRSQQVIDKLRSPVKPAGTTDQPPADGGPIRQTVLFDMLDDKMRSAVAETMHRNIETLNQQMSHEWDEIFKKQEHAEAGGGPSGEGH
ncbi:MAG: serine/threonine protein kinase [Planctomycetia bacterium]|nr:serine/threonine protein kinase [Planctomycetia bacterium]